MMGVGCEGARWRRAGGGEGGVSICISADRRKHMSSYNPSNIFARARLVKTRHVTQYAPTKIGEYPSDIPQFK